MSADILTQLEEIVGSGRLTTAAAVGEFEFPWATHGTCQAKAIVYPQTTDEVAEIMSVCNAAQQTVVPFGGATNLVQGCATTVDDIVLSLEKMNTIEEVDTGARTLVAQAGVTLQDQLPVGRHRVDECRRHQGHSLWHDAGYGSGPRSGACRWHGNLVNESLHQE